MMMIAIFAPTYATLTMGYFEVHFYNIFELKWGKEFQESIVENWSRFLDDYQIPLDNSTVKLEELLETLNPVNEAIQFTMEFSDKEIPFPEKHLRTSGTGNFTIFLFLQLRSNDTDLRREYGDYVIKKYKTKLNSL